MRHPERDAHPAPDGASCILCDKQELVFLLPASDLFDLNYDDPDNQAPSTFLCGECLVDGEFHASEVPIHSGDLDSLWEALRQSYPDMNPKQLGEEADLRLSELAEATPPLRLPLAGTWPIHCDDFCECIGIITQKEIPALIESENLSKAKLELSEMAGDSAPTDQVAVFACLSCQAVQVVPVQT